MLRLILIGLLFCGAFGCSKVGQGNSGGVLVVATTGMIADMAKAIAGPKIEVVALMGPGVDPHTYKASPGDVRQLARADLVLYHGLHLEGKMGEVLEQVAKKKPVVAVAERLDPKSLIRSGGVPDPHVWMDPSLWKDCVPVVKDALKKVVHGEDLEARASEYGAMLSALAMESLAKVSEVPEPQRVLITAHDAFGYFGAAYGFEVKGIQGLSTESEAGLREINQLVDLIVGRKVKAIFVESSVSEKNVNALVEGARRRGAKVEIGGTLYSDAMGAEGTIEGTYAGMIRHNVQTIVEALR